jgi:hypothetical protein
LSSNSSNTHTQNGETMDGALWLINYGCTSGFGSGEGGWGPPKPESPEGTYGTWLNSPV